MDHDSTIFLESERTVFATVVADGSVAGYQIDPPGRAPGLFVGAPRPNSGLEYRGVLVKEADERHALVLRKYTSIIDRYRIDRVSN
jgi:hypothetical protein